MKNRVTEGRDKWVQENITRLNREMEEGKYNQPPTPAKSNLISLWFDGTGYAFANGQTTAINLNLNTSQNILPWVHYSVYLNGTKSAANKYRSGANWDAIGLEEAQIHGRWDYGEGPGSGLDKIVYQIEVSNYTGGILRIALEAEARYLPSNVVLA